MSIALYLKKGDDFEALEAAACDHCRVVYACAEFADRCCRCTFCGEVIEKDPKDTSNAKKTWHDECHTAYLRKRQESVLSKCTPITTVEELNAWQKEQGNELYFLDWDGEGLGDLDTVTENYTMFLEDGDNPDPDRWLIPAKLEKYPGFSPDRVMEDIGEFFEDAFDHVSDEGFNKLCEALKEFNEKECNFHLYALSDRKVQLRFLLEITDTPVEKVSENVGQ